MIRLYKMELYKLFQNRIFRLGMLSAIVLLALYFCLAEVGGEIAVVDGVSYSGYEAVRINRQITAEFEGELTDEKVNQIIERYGLPSKLEENMPGWRDGNFLNDFVTRFFTNGSWEKGALPTEQYAFADTELAKASAKTGQSPYLAYTKGWTVFVEMLQLGLVLGSILVICGVSTIFADESQTKMLPLLLSTKEGRRKDVYAKLLAAFSFTIVIFVCLTLFSLIMCDIVYGLKGFNNIAGMITTNGIMMANGTIQAVTFSKYLAIQTGLGFVALLSLCAITLCVSAHLNSTFGAVIIAASFWGLPVLIRMFFGDFMAVIVDSMPVFLIMTTIINDICVIWGLVLLINIFLAGTCLINGIFTYKNKQLT